MIEVILLKRKKKIWGYWNDFTFLYVDEDFKAFTNIRTELMSTAEKNSEMFAHRHWTVSSAPGILLKPLSHGQQRQTFRRHFNASAHPSRWRTLRIEPNAEFSRHWFLPCMAYRGKTCDASQTPLHKARESRKQPHILLPMWMGPLAG